MNKTQRRKQRSDQWKKDNDWGLSAKERSTKRKTRAHERIDEMLVAGKDASLLIELFYEAYGEKP